MYPFDRLTKDNLKFAKAARQAYEDGQSEICNETLGRHVNYLIDEMMGSAPSSTHVCRVCGYTDEHACPGGCHWVESDLCSSCV